MDENLFKADISELGLNSHGFHDLKMAGYNTIEDLCLATQDDMMQVQNLSRKSLEEVMRKLDELGLSLEYDFATECDDRADSKYNAHGKDTCAMLRGIRIKIAELNDIPFSPVKCDEDAPCNGTCPACDAEAEYLDRQLQRIVNAGGEIVLDGIVDIKNERSVSKYPVTNICRHRCKIDGDGIRTLVLFHGCPLHCEYCINPHTLDQDNEVTWMTAEEIYHSVMKDRIYLRASGGGVTFGGGEPLLQFNAIKDFAKINAEGISVFVETSLNVPRQYLEEVLEYVDRFYVDIKTMDPEKYEQYTGGNLSRVIDNLEFLLDAIDVEQIYTRVPLIPGITDMDDQLEACEELEDIGVRYIERFSYHLPEEVKEDKLIEGQDNVWMGREELPF